MSSDSPDQLLRLYQETIRRHSAEPTGFRQGINHTHSHEAYNPLCGDRIEVQLRVSGEKVESAAFDGEACAICMASASLLCSVTPGRSVAGLIELGRALRETLQHTGEASTENRVVSEQALPEELHALLGVRPYPSRIQCATLPWTAAHKALCGDREGQDP